MTTYNNRPAWWQVILIALGILGLLAWGALAHLSESGHTAAAAGTVLLTWALVEAWLRANRRALLHVEGLHLVEQPDGGSESGAAEDAPQPVLLAGSGAQASVPLPAGQARQEGVPQ